MNTKKKIIGIFLDHDLFIRNFIFSKVFLSLERKYKIIYIFPNEENRPGVRRRITKGLINKLKIKNKKIIQVDFKRHKFLRFFHLVSNLFFSRYKTGLDKKAFLHFNYHSINSRSVTIIFRFLSLYPIFFITSWVFKNIILKDNIFLKEALIKNKIDLILHPTAWEGFFDSDLIDLGKKLNIPSIFLMNSWDNTNLSGMTNGHSDKYLVWGKKSKIYAEKFKKIPRENISVIGSAQFSINKSKINYKKIIKIKKKDDYILYAGSNLGLNESEHLKTIDEYISKNNLKYKIVYRPHPWKQKAKGEKHILNFKTKNIILDPFSVKNYNNLFNFKSRNKLGIISSMPNESSIIIKKSSGVIGPIGTLMLEACWNKIPSCAIFPKTNEKTNLKNQFKYHINLKHIQDFLKELNIPLLKDTKQLGAGLDFIIRKTKETKFKSRIYKDSLKYLDPNINYTKNLSVEIKKII